MLSATPVFQGSTVPEEDGRPPVYPGVAEPFHVSGKPQQDHPGDGKLFISPGLVSWDTGRWTKRRGAQSSSNVPAVLLKN